MSDDDYDREMQAKLAAFMSDEGMENDVDEDDEDDEEEGQELNIPDDLPDFCLDHVIIACCDLKEGMEQFEDMTGIAPKKIGALRGVGTKSARVALDGNKFVEIIGPDPNATSEGIAPKLLNIPKGELRPYHYVIRAKPADIKLPDGWQKDEVTMVHADTKQFSDTGEVFKWDLIFIYGHGIGGCVPKFVNWREKRFHPTAFLPKTDGKLAFIQAQAPEGHYLHELLESVNDVTVYPGEPKLTFSFDTPKGNVQFEGENPEGIVMPGFGDDSHPTYSGKPM